MHTEVCFAIEIVAFGKWVLDLVSQSVQIDWLCLGFQDVFIKTEQVCEMC